MQAAAYFVLALLLDACQRQTLRLPAWLRLPTWLQLGLQRLHARLQPLWRRGAWRQLRRPLQGAKGAKGDLSGAGTGSAVDAELELAGLQNGSDRSAVACVLCYSIV